MGPEAYRASRMITYLHVADDATNAVYTILSSVQHLVYRAEDGIHCAYAQRSWQVGKHRTSIGLTESLLTSRVPGK